MAEEAYYKEYDVKNNEATPQETFLLVVPSVLYCLLANLITSLYYSKFSSSKVLSFIIEFFTIIIPIIGNFCVLLSLHSIIATFLFATICLLILIRRLNPIQLQKVSVSDKQKIKLKPHITNVRAITIIMTIISILAVDFEIFPIRFAKTNTYGFSLMDLGVGLFIFSNGIVAPEVRGLQDPISRSLKTVFVLLLLGTARWLLTNQINYHVPITEYGRHWNFFITLAVTKLFTTFLLNIVTMKYIIFNAIALMFCHEVLLETGLKQFVFNKTKREGLLVANKEGVVSVLGYIALNLFTIYFSYIINSLKDKTKIVMSYLTISIICLFLTFALHSQFPISRKLANSTYCFWILFIGMFIMFLFYATESLIEKVCKTRLGHFIYCPFIFEAVNYNGLSFFLLGNVLTGLVNVSTDTLNITNDMALIIIVGYTFVNCLFVCLLYHTKVRLKF